MRSIPALNEIRGFNRFYTNLIGVLDRHILKSPYSLTEVRLLYEVSLHRLATARKLKDALSVDEGYLSRTIERLVTRGLLHRRQSAADGRVFHLALSSRGTKAFLKLNELAESEIAALVGHLSPKELKEVVSSMRRIKDLLGRGGAAS